jgi:hypothetical protein
VRMRNATSTLVDESPLCRGTGETMITLTGVLVLMLAYTALALGGLSLFWHLRTGPQNKCMSQIPESLALKPGRPNDAT